MGLVTRLEPSSPPHSGVYFPTLDGWRAIAVVLVMLHHASMCVWGKPFWAKLINSHQMGVEVFFVLSGFLITSLLVREYDKYGTISFKAFYLRRFFRIVPAQVVYLAAIAALFLAGLVQTSWSRIAAAIFWIRNWLHGDWVDGHFWSLAIEEQFYACWPVAFLLFTRKTNRLVACAGTLFALTAWVEIDHHFALFEKVFPSIPAWSRTDLRVAPLLWGALGALALADTAMNERLARWAKATVPLLVVLGIAYKLLGDSPQRRTAYWMMLVLALLATVRHSTSIAGRVLESAPMRWIGRRSYGMYLWQQLFLIPTDTVTWLPFRGIPQILVGFAAVFCIAAISYRFLEQPLLRIGHRLSSAVLARAESKIPRSQLAA